jgi:tRNA dimethylallyltransferase
VTPVLAVFGATASGKSSYALERACALGGEIVNCDAMQLYAGLPILTNQPSAAERARAPHHLVGVWPLHQEGDVATYAAAAHRVVDEILARGRTPIVVGGTGLYLRAALADLELPPAPPPGLRERLEAEYDAEPAAAYARLRAVDAAAAERVHANDRRRVVRALELHQLGASLAPAHDRLWSASFRHPTRIVALEVPRDELRRRIAARTEEMFRRGVVEEVRAALAALPPSTTAARILGLDEIGALIAGEVDEATARRRLVTRTQQYARRQETWMRRIPDPVFEPAG